VDDGVVESDDRACQNVAKGWMCYGAKINKECYLKATLNLYSSRLLVAVVEER
jgi:hypothetical protein